MRDINDLNNEYLSDRAFRTRHTFKTGTTTYIGKLRTEEWMVRKIVESTETTITEATRFNNSYTTLDTAWANKLTLTYE